MPAERKASRRSRNLPQISDAEWEVMKTHCEIGAQILRGDSETMRAFLAWSKVENKPGARGAVNPIRKIGTIAGGMVSTENRRFEPS